MVGTRSKRVLSPFVHLREVPLCVALEARTPCTTSGHFLPQRIPQGLPPPLRSVLQRGDVPGIVPGVFRKVGLSIFGVADADAGTLGGFAIPPWSAWGQ